VKIEDEFALMPESGKECDPTKEQLNLV